MNKPATGQYECVHSSGIGLDYFTSRIDRLTLFGNGRFTLITQDRSRISNMAQSFLSGQGTSAAAAPAQETRKEGSYVIQQNAITFNFDDGTQEQGQLSWNGDGIQLGKLFFNKVSDSTILPPTDRMKKNMDDIAKGLKIAGTIGGMAMKVAKTVHETLQTDEPATHQGQPQVQSPVQNAAPPTAQPARQAPPAQHYPPPPQPQRPVQQPPPSYQPAPPVQQAQQAQPEPIYCDQCGTLARPGKRFCSNCGAALPLD